LAASTQSYFTYTYSISPTAPASIVATISTRKFDWSTATAANVGVYTISLTGTVASKNSPAPSATSSF
jgi:hypothetical protein